MAGWNHVNRRRRRLAYDAGYWKGYANRAPFDRPTNPKLVEIFERGVRNGRAASARGEPPPRGGRRRVVPRHSNDPRRAWRD